MQNTAFHLCRPELTGNHELFVNIQRFADVNRSVRPLRRIVQLHICRVTGTGIIPAVGGFQGHAVQFLHHRQVPVRLQRLQQVPSEALMIPPPISRSRFF